MHTSHGLEKLPPVAQEPGNISAKNQVPAELPRHVLNRFHPLAQKVLSELMAHAGEPVRPVSLRSLFDDPTAKSTPVRISQYLRQAREDPDTGQWVQRWGNSTQRYFMWGTPEQAAPYEERAKKDTSPKRPAKDLGRPVVPRTRPKQSQVTASGPDGRPSAFATGMAVREYKLGPELSEKQRDSERGAMVVKAWGIEAAHDDLDITVSIGGTALTEIDTLAAEVMEAVADITDGLAPSDIRLLVAEFHEPPPGIKSILDRLDLWRRVMPAFGIDGWNDSGPVAPGENGRRFVRFDLPDEADHMR